MEPTDLNRSALDDAQLDTWLRSNAAAVPLPDNGFSQRVLASLPPPASRAAGWRRLIFCIAGAAAGVVVPLLTDFGQPDPAISRVDLGRISQQALQPLADSNVLLAATVTGLCLLYVFGLPRLLSRR
jgi:hypothetical protein